MTSPQSRLSRSSASLVPSDAQALGSEVEEFVHDAGKVRVVERGAEVGHVERVAGVQVGVLVAAHLVLRMRRVR